jgi:hypothetical protein
MSELLDEINSVIEDDTADRARIERTLTDGYAHALTLESERLRLEKRIGELAHRDEAAPEIALLTRELDGNAGDLSRLRGVLAQLKRKPR